MQKFVEVFWSPYLGKELDIVALPPKPFFPILREARLGSKYLECPAIIDLCKNEFVISSPFDLNITVDRENKNIITDRFGQNFYDTNVYNRMDITPDHCPALITIPIRYLFYSFTPVEIEVTDLPFITSKSAENYRVLRGGFDIGKWMRPVELAVEVIDSSKQINLKTEDPLFLLRFKTPDNIPIKFTRVILTDKHFKAVRSCTAVKDFRPRLKLKDVYKLAENYLEAFRKNN